MSEPHRWSRSSYPLQSTATTKIMEQPQRQYEKSSPSPNDAHQAALAQLLRKLDATNAIPVPWYQAVTEDRESQRSSTSQLDHESNHSNDPNEDTQTYGGSSTAVTMSQRSSLSPVKYDAQPNEINSSLPSLPQSVNGENESASQVSSSWTQIPYQTQGMINSAVGHIPQSPLRTPPPQTRDMEERSEQVSPVPSFDDTGSINRTRTLRRTPWTRRIGSPTSSPVETKETFASTAPPVTSYARSVTAQSETSVPGAFPDDDDDAPAENKTNTGMKYWGREEYPVQSSLVDLPKQALSTPTSTREPWLVRRGLSDEDEIASTTGNQQVSHYPLPKPVTQMSTVPDTVESLKYQQEKTVSEPVAPLKHQQEKTDETLQQIKPSVNHSSQTYPLQIPASNVRRSPTPPPSPPETATVQTTIAPTEPLPINKSTVMFRRKVYPLQSPASIRDLRGSPSPPASPDRESDSANKTIMEPPTNTERNLQPANVVKRQGYPLQSPASNANLRQSSGISSDEARDTVAPALHHPKPQRVVPTKSLRRNVYPLQSPASIVDLRDPPAQVASSESNSASGVVEQALVYQDERPTPSFRRRGYPLQSQASTTKLRPTPQPVPDSSMKPIKESPLPNIGIPEQAPTQPSLHQKYPQQATIGHLAPQLPPSKPQTQQNRETFDTNTEVQQAAIPATQVGEKKPQSSAYPLQSPLDALSNSTSLPVPTITVEEPNKKDENSERQRRESELATKVVQQWRRQVYPTQSPKTAIPFQRPITPQPPVEENKKPKTQSIHLPKNISAIEDVDKPAPGGRTIVVCLDGTGDKFDNDNSNIVHLVSALKKDDPNQITYYQAGIGTYGDGGLSGGISAAMDMAVGSGLGLHVRDAYHFLMHTYQEGDRICIFGFSRGAYTARCLGGMIHKVGLLPARNIQQIPFAYGFYAMDTEEGWKQSEDFKKTFCIDVNVYFLGCFDSVASVGFIPRQLPLSSTPTNKPRYFRHAMALDERRAKFKICRHQAKNWDEIVGSETPKEEEHHLSDLLPHTHHSFSRHKDQQDAPPRRSIHSKPKKGLHFNMTDEEYEKLSGHDHAFDTDVLEVWFAGAHADIGGGAVPNDERHKLAQIPLRWMIRQAFECNTGILFKTKLLAEYGLDVHTLWPRYQRLKVPSHGPPPSMLEKYSQTLPPRSLRSDKLVPIGGQEQGEPMYQLKNYTDEDWTPEQVEDFYDAMSPVNDQLIQAPTWWILEMWPVQYKVPLAPGEVAIRTGMNLGRYRGVEDAEPKLHWTVQHRVEQMAYRIGIRTAPQASWKYVV